ncbi:hypothetical protein AXF42_Ash005896 [Apostasia shenzhenica]|uniref:Uncharacterized protein n=1 Tax=Apostasia shenzhenica TaxID=1088818 RepID=A0A2I0BCP3_9ASPA|nr:hypothetical protein AXF42_Ash005896 [Apostasia shenzhenica]
MMENSIIERVWAGVALGWVTSWEVLKSRSFSKAKVDNISVLRSQDVTRDVTNEDNKSLA